MKFQLCTDECPLTLALVSGLDLHLDVVTVEEIRRIATGVRAGLGRPERHSGQHSDHRPLINIGGLRHCKVYQFINTTFLFNSRPFKC